MATVENTHKAGDTAMLAAALELSQLGPVFPLHTAEAGACSCGKDACSSPGKHPRTANGLKAASQDADTIAGWWTSWPAANIGLATGALVVLDVDGPEGRATLEALTAEHGPLPATRAARTGREGGGHLYFRAPEGERIGNAAGARGRGLGEGLDVRGIGGYVVAPPSLHASGKRYAWAGDLENVAELPAWIVEKLTAPAKVRDTAAVVPIRSTPAKAGTRDERYVQAALEREAQSVRGAREGERNHQLNASAFSLGQLVGSGAIGEGDVRAQLNAAGEAAGLGLGELTATLDSGLRAGMAEPRGIPEQTVKAAQASSSTGRPTVPIGHRPLEDMTADALAALKKANEPARTFVREGRLTRVVRDEQGRAVVEPMGEDALRGTLARSATFGRPNKDGELKAVAPPLEVVRDVRALGEWPDLPQLVGLVEAPAMRSDGSVLSTPGYDRASGLYYSPSSPLALPAIPDRPTQANAQAALELLAEPLAEFPFAEPADRANALALMLTPLVRAMFSGNVPLALVEAPRAGTGKGLLLDMVATLATGRGAELTATPRHDEEAGKVLGALLMEGASLIVLDEAETLGGSALCSMLTSERVRVRVLGRSQTARVPQRATWAALGNNPRVRGDMPRRIYRVRLDAKVAVPWARRFERADLRGWALEHRAELLAAALTCARAWHVAGRPGAPAERLGGFEGWSATLGGILAYAGEGAFLGNLKDTQDEADEESLALGGFLEALEAAYGLGTPFTVADLCERLEGSGVLRGALPDDLASLEPGRLRDRLGKTLGKNRDTRHGERGVRVEHAGMTRTKTRAWRILADAPRDEDSLH